MKEFILYSVNDPNMEPIHKLKAETLEEAVEKFCMIKNLPLQSFLKLFEVKEI